MHIDCIWNAPRKLPMLTDLEFTLKNGEKVMISWESANFNKREFHATGVSTTDDNGHVSSGNLAFLRENIDKLIGVHYLSDSEDSSCVKMVTFTDQVKGHYKTESWVYENPGYWHHL